MHIRSKHPSIAPLRKSILLPFRAIYRHGSVTELDMNRYKVEINSAEAIRNSGSKLRMKACFDKAQIRSPEWFTARGDKLAKSGGDSLISLSDAPYPLVAKKIFGSQGKGMVKLDTEQQAREFFNTHIKPGHHGYYFERFYNYTREYRLHVTKGGCFYTCRKMLKSDAPKDKRWFRNDSNSVNINMRLPIAI